MYLYHSPFTLHHHHSGIRDVKLLTQKLVFRSIKGYDKIEITAYKVNGRNRAYIPVSDD